MGQLCEYEKQNKLKEPINNSSTIASTSNNNSSNLKSSSLSSSCGKNLVANSINQSCQQFLTITKKAFSIEKPLKKEEETNDVKTTKPKMKMSIPLLKYKKPFIFDAFSSCSSNTSQNEDNDNNSSNNVKQYCFSTASVPQLQSPCQALASFNFNSPQVEKTINELFPPCASTELNNTNNNSSTTTITTTTTTPTNTTCTYTTANDCQRVKFRHKTTNENEIKYIPKSLTIDTLNEFEILNSSSTTKYSSSRIKRCAIEHMDVDVDEKEGEQENVKLECGFLETKNSECKSLNDTLKLDFNNNSKKSGQLTRPSSIFLHKQYLIPIKETTNTSVSSATSISSSSSTGPLSSSSSTSSYFSFNSVSSPMSITSTSSSNSSNSNTNELQIESNKKIKLSPIKDINTISIIATNFSNSSNNNNNNSSKLISSFSINTSSIISPLDNTTAKSKSSENLSDSNQCPNQTSRKYSNFKNTIDTITTTAAATITTTSSAAIPASNKNKPTKLPTDSRSFETFKNLFKEDEEKANTNTSNKSQSTSLANSTSSSKSSLHGSIEKMIEVS